MHEYRVRISGLNDPVLEFSAEALVQLDTDNEPQWTSVQHWSVDNPMVSGRARTEFPDQAAADQGWLLLPGPRRPTEDGRLVVAAEPTDWELVLARVTETAEHFRRIEAAWRTL